MQVSERNRSVAVAIAIGLCGLGWLAGSFLGRKSAQQTRRDFADSQARRVMKRLLSNRAIYEIGDLPMWSPDGSRATRLGDEAPDGCVVYYAAPGCPSCLDGILELPNWLARHRRRGDSVIVLIDSGENAAEFEESIRVAGLKYPVWADAEQCLRLRYEIWQNPVILILAGADLRLAAVGVWDSKNGIYIVDTS